MQEHIYYYATILADKTSFNVKRHLMTDCTKLKFKKFRNQCLLNYQTDKASNRCDISTQKDQIRKKIQVKFHLQIECPIK